MDSRFKALAEIVGEGYASKEPEELYIYARDLGTSEPHLPDYVVMPKTTEEVQAIVELANRDKIPLVPLGGGLNLNGLTLPLRGGIVVDMRRMDRILEVDEKSRYAVIEAGVSEGRLKAYLERYHPDLEHSTPHAPPGASVVANALIHGEGHLVSSYGSNSGMLNGLEVVLPTGEVCKIGSCSLSPYWFSKGAPLPDLSSLFIGWVGTTGIVTKASFKLYPKPKKRDLVIFTTENLDLIPDIIFKISQVVTADDLKVAIKKLPQMPRGPLNQTTLINGNSDEEIELKKRLIEEALKEYVHNGQGEFVTMTLDVKADFLEVPKRSDTASADILKGGGYQEADVVLPVEKFPDVCRGMFEIASKYALEYYSMSGRCIGLHNIKCYWSFRFNRADAHYIERVRKALRDATELGVKMGGLLSRPEPYGQELTVERMEPNTVKLMMRIKELMDPHHIMNPGNWELSEK